MIIIFILLALIIGLIFGSLGALSYAQTGIRKKEETLQAKERTWMESKQDLLLQNQSLQDKLKQMEEWEQKEKQRQDNMTKEFQFLSTKIYEQQQRIFGHQSKEHLGNILQPLKDRIQNFGLFIDKKMSDQMKEQYLLKHELNSMNKATSQVIQKTQELTQAIKTDIRTQGVWGETILERAMELSGLIRNQDYVLQGEGLKIKDEQGKALKPDVVVFLPKQKFMVVDAKMSFVSYDTLLQTTKENQPQAENDFIQSVKKHIDGLAQKRYYQYVDQQKTSPDFVMLFMPLEPAYMVALRLDSSLIQYSLNKRVILTSPSTLMASLKLISDLWRFDRVNKNALEVVKYTATLYGKMQIIIQTLQKAERQVQGLDTTLDELANQTYRGKKSLLQQTGRLGALGKKVVSDDDEEPIAQVSYPNVVIPSSLDLSFVPEEDLKESDVDNEGEKLENSEDTKLQDTNLWSTYNISNTLKTSNNTPKTKTKT